MSNNQTHSPSYKALKRQNRRLKATISRLREELEVSSELVNRFMDRVVDEHGRAERYMAAIVEAKELIYKASDHAFKSEALANKALVTLAELQLQCPAKGGAV